jgi:hypothetical protein
MAKRNGWDLAIDDAKEMIASFEKKIKRLKESIQVFEQEREDGKEWPGDKELAIHRELAR